MKIIKAVCKFIIKLFHTIYWIAEVVMKTDCKNHVIPSDERLLLNILANGPSLMEDIKRLNFSDGDYSVVNYFYKSDCFAIIKPSFYVIIDPFFFEDGNRCKPIIDIVNWPMKLVVPYYAWKKCEVLHNMKNKFIEVVPVHNICYNGFECFRHWIFKHGLAMPKTQNVLVPSIFNGINMGYKEIRLYGVDHSWTKTLCVTEDNQVCAIDTHFYDTHQATLKPYGNHKLHELLRFFALMFEAYQLLRPYAESMECRIINKTKGSFIDAFERG